MTLMTLKISSRSPKFNELSRSPNDVSVQVGVNLVIGFRRSLCRQGFSYKYNYDPVVTLKIRSRSLKANFSQSD